MPRISRRRISRRRLLVLVVPTVAGVGPSDSSRFVVGGPPLLLVERG